MFGKGASSPGEPVSQREATPHSRSLDDLMQLTFEIWVVGMLLYYLALSALNLG